jgi:DNA-binding response OmpR family regulator
LHKEILTNRNGGQTVPERNQRRETNNGATRVCQPPLRQEDVMNTILLVDGDHKTLSLLYADELTEEGYEVITGETSHRLGRLIKTTGPEMVVLDSTAAEDDIAYLLKDIRNASADIPVIVSTAYDLGGPHTNVSIADPYVERSSNFRELKRKIRKASRNSSHNHQFHQAGIRNDSRSDNSCLQYTL